MTEALLKQALLLSLAIVLLWLIRRPLRRLGAGAVYAAWLLVPALLLTAALPRPAQEPLRLVLRVTGASAAAPALPKLPKPADHTASALLTLWLAGAALVALVQARRQWRLARLGPQLPAGSSPALVGLLRPRVALPADFEQRFSPTERELILAHEQVHRERLDNLWNLLACTLTALHWWNPLAWWAARRFQADQELACDAAVLASRPGALADYTRALLAAHDLRSLGAPLASRWGSTHPLVERIAMLKHPRPLNRRRALLLAATVGMLTTLTYAAGESAATPAGTFMLFEVALEQKQGDSRTTRNFRLVGREGARMMVTMGKAGQPDSMKITLLPRKIDEGQVRIEAEVSAGEPLVELGRPAVQTGWGQKARVEFAQDATGQQYAMEITPTALPADYQPPTRPATKPPQ